MLSRLRRGWALAQFLRHRGPLLRRASDAAGIPSSSILSYLVNSCGISPELAPAVAKKAAFESPEKADAVLEFLRSRGFSQAQVAECVRKDPKLLRVNAEKFLRPKFEALEGSGLEKALIAELVCRQPRILELPYEKNGLIANVVAFLRSLVPKESEFVGVLSRCRWIIGYGTLALIKPNVDLLLNEGVPMKNISYGFYRKPLLFAVEPARFVEMVQSVKDLGFSRPSIRAFIRAIMARAFPKKWDEKVKVYKSFGLSDDQILAAFRVEPQILIISEDKIRKGMGYFVGVKGIAPGDVLKYPFILLVSLEKRVKPRYKIMDVLAERGIVRDWNFNTIFMKTEKVFLAHYVTRHEEKIPELLNLYSAELLK